MRQLTYWSTAAAVGKSEVGILIHIDPICCGPEDGGWLGVAVKFAHHHLASRVGFAEDCVVVVVVVVALWLVVQR